LIEDRRLNLTLMVAAVIITLAVLWGASESHYSSCVAAAQARYPAVPVSALTTKVTGPLKLSFVKERQKAVGDCSHVPIF
jgi:archaellum component FlaF (FlaF/FlaG flagellin family)